MIFRVGVIFNLHIKKKVSNYMITPKQIREIREFKGLSLREVAKYCDITPQLIGQVETEVKNITHENYKQIISGINKAFAAKQNEIQK